ncbi:MULTISPECIES: helix-turn-helix transcriptional regulator [Staphylococcus]|uniref:helix-turn-helix domain-containing protein n=1 Tax=Staphylococcus TaxID=1279 RepID=UPI00024E1826|nr:MULTISPECIES: helix-turn-helix transcriptional regulator [Staphylococcus]MDU5411047.1 helix-turn-helix transcriptional regulator [Staphylococcus haemolyticus]MDU6090304.1 helix-turn-helix transcriptional regulator [Staphylococcus lugdunensis]MDU6533731.1 helix-turn-helix transcriptional regulator [Alloscardovia omnicolens]MDU7038299.1 helix-turn-helix transcriptional regulator [Lactococcus lactis]DAW17296.1 MAG TPA: Cro/C1-type HTH DNA-binding domain protein [Bacteriophage sp.]
MILCTLKNYMKLFGATQSQISEQTGITRPTLLSLIRNENKNIKYDTIDELCNFFGIQLKDLLIYSPVKIKQKSFNIKTIIEEYEHINESWKTYGVSITYEINNEDFIFEGSIDPIDLKTFKNKKFENGTLYLNCNCFIEKDNYENLLKAGFSKEFFDLYNDLNQIKNKIVDKLPFELDSDLLIFNIFFNVRNAPSLEEYKEELQFLPTDSLIDLKNEIERYLK